LGDPMLHDHKGQSNPDTNNKDNKENEMLAWLKNTHDSNHSLADDLKVIREANWKAPSKSISQSPSLVTGTRDSNSQSTSKETSKANCTEEYDSILETNYMREASPKMVYSHSHGAEIQRHNKFKANN
jgi:hypothetical protein